MAPRRQLTPDDLERLEGIVTDFVTASRTMLENDHKKIDLVYDFLFLGRPDAEPPVAPFVSQVQSSLANHRKDIDGIQQIGSRVIWSFVGLAIGGLGWFIGTTLLHIFSK